MRNLEQYVETKLKEKCLTSFGQYHPYPKACQREFWEKCSSRVRQYYIAEGENALSFQWLSVEATSFLDFYRTGDRTKNEVQNFSKRKALGALILAECFECKGRFLEAIVNGIWSVCEETVWAVSAHLKFRGQRDMLPDTEFGQPLDLFSLETAQLIAFADYMLGDELDQISKAITRRMRKELYERVIQPYLSHEDYWWMGYTGYSLNNWAPWCTCNALSAILLSCRDEELRKAALLKSAKILDSYLEFVPEDGSCDEGTAYWLQAGLRVIQAMDVLRGGVGGGTEVFQSPKIKNIAHFIIHNHIDREWYVNFADGAAKMPVTIPCGLMYLSCVLEDKALEAEAAALFEQNPGLETAQSGYDPGRVMMNVLYYDRLSQISVRPVLEQTVWYPGTQVMICREWPEYGKGLFLAAKGGHNGESHNHNDVGSFIVFKNGKPVLIDVGVGVYTRQTFGPERYSIWTMRSVYHNLPLLKEGEQKPGKEFGARAVRFDSGQEGDRLFMDLSAAYGLEKDTVRREVLFDRQAGEIRVTDRLNRKRECQWVLMTAVRPEIQETMLLVGDCRVAVSAGVIAVEPMTLEDQKLKQVWGGECYRVLITGETDCQTIRIR